MLPYRKNLDTPGDSSPTQESLLLKQPHLSDSQKVPLGFQIYDSFPQSRPTFHTQNQMVMPQEATQQVAEAVDSPKIAECQVGHVPPQIPQVQEQSGPLPKNKQIKKQPKEKKAPRLVKKRALPESEDEESEIDQEADISTRTTKIDGGRSQNNCKYYHKLPKNYLYSKKLGHLIDAYHKQFSNRYYFVVAMILIREHLNEDFRPIYAGQVSAELKKLNKKITKKLKQVRTIERALKRLSQGSEEYKLKFSRKGTLEEKIVHLQMVKNEISQLSVKACNFFFETGDAVETLRILYLKDNQRIKKLEYYQEAVQRVSQIQMKVTRSRLN